MSTPTTARIPIPHRAALTALLLTSTLTVMAGAIVSPVLEVIRGDLGISGTEAGFILTAHSLTLALASPVAGRLIDRYGVRTPLTAGLLLYGVTGSAGGLADSYLVLIATRVFFGFAAAFVFSGTTVALLALYHGRDRDKVMGWRSSAMSVGGIVWSLLAGALGGLGWHITFAIYAVAIPLAVATGTALPASTRTGTGKDENAGPRGGSLTLLRHSPALLGFYLLLVIDFFLAYALAIFMPTRLAEVGIEEPFMVAVITLGTALGTPAIGLVYAPLRARLSYSFLLRAMAVLWLAGFALLGTTDEPLLMVVGLVLYGLGGGIVFPVATVLINEHTPTELRGRSVALSGTAIFAGQFAAPLVLGPVVDATTTKAGYLGAAAVSALVLLALLIARVREPGPEQTAEGTARGPRGSDPDRQGAGT